MTVIGPVVGEFSPTHPAISYTDHAGVSITSARARFLRPVAFSTWENFSPGARVRFRSNAPRIIVRLGFNGLAGTEIVDATTVLINGVATDFANTGYPSAFDQVLEFATSDYRTIEVIFPYVGALDFRGVSQDPAYDFRACLPRPDTKLLAVGDSITMGAIASKTRSGYVYGLSAALNIEAVNMGFTSARTEQFADTSWSAALAPNVITVMLGFNDFAAQTALATFKSRYTTILNGLLVATSAKIVAITPLWTSADLATPISSYRTWIAEAVTAIGNSRLSLVDGLSLIPNSSEYFVDGVHPNDTGFAQMISALKAPVLAAF